MKVRHLLPPTGHRKIRKSLTISTILNDKNIGDVAERNELFYLRSRYLQTFLETYLLPYNRKLSTEPFLEIVYLTIVSKLIQDIFTDSSQTPTIPNVPSNNLGHGLWTPSLTPSIRSR